MTDPTDAELLEFIARFAGWIPGTGSCAGLVRQPGLTATYYRRENIPDYIHDLNAWHRDVWPKISQTVKDLWQDRLALMFEDGPWDAINSDARSRCLALWRALDGKLPERSDT